MSPDLAAFAYFTAAYGLVALVWLGARRQQRRDRRHTDPRAALMASATELGVVDARPWRLR